MQEFWQQDDLIATGIVAESGFNRTKRQYPKSIGDQFGNQFFTERRYPKKQQVTQFTTSKKPPLSSQTKPQVVSNIVTGFANKFITDNRSPPNQLTSLMPVLFQPAQASVQCASTCVGRTTSEYNPVCGTDGQGGAVYI